MPATPPGRLCLGDLHVSPAARPERTRKGVGPSPGEDRTRPATQLRSPPSAAPAQADARCSLKKPVSFATAVGTYASLSYRSMCVAPSTQKSSFGSPALSTASRLK